MTQALVSLLLSRGLDGGSFSLPVKELKGRENLELRKQQWRNLTQQTERTTEGRCSLERGNTHIQRRHREKDPLQSRWGSQKTKIQSLIEGWNFFSASEEVFLH